MKPHAKLECWKKSFFLVKKLYLVTVDFPLEERFGLISQIRRAAVSVPANIAEGAGRKSSKEFLNFLSMAMGSVSELDTMILLFKELGFLNMKESEEIIAELDMIGKLIFGLMKKLGYNSEKGEVRSKK